MEKLEMMQFENIKKIMKLVLISRFLRHKKSLFSLKKPFFSLKKPFFCYNLIRY